MRTRILAAWLFCAAFTACGDLDVRSIAGTETLPAALGGVWTGTWESEVDSSTGSMSIRIQEFAGEPVVSLTIDNPCLQPREYELLIADGRIGLSLDGRTVFEAALVGEGELSGSYGCELDSGTWSAVRTGDLPDPIDLSGPWNGRVFVPGQFDQQIDLQLTQSVRAGGLTIDGTVVVPGVVPFPLELEGGVVFRENDFELLLRTSPGVEPGLVLTGVGSREPLEVPVGLVNVLSTQSLPFTQGLFEMEPDEGQ